MCLSYTDEPPAKSGIDSSNNTNFNRHEAASHKQQKFARLWYYQENLKRDRSNFNSEEIRRREKNHILDAISSQLELPEYQHTEAKQILDQTNFTDEVEGRFLSIETYCFAICVLVWNENRDSQKLKVLPFTDNLSNFTSLQDELDISDEKLDQALTELEYGVVEGV